MRLVAVADTGPRVGLGHLMRSRALAAAWRESGGESLLVACGGSAELAARLGDACPLRVVPAGLPAAECAALLAEEGASCASLDGYRMDAAFQRAARRAARPLLVIDDHAHLPRYHADLVLNQNHGAGAYRYRSALPLRTLTGTRYVLLRPEVRRAAVRRREFPPVARRLLVTLGGAEQAGATAAVLAALARVAEPLEVRVVVGPAAALPAQGDLAPPWHEVEFVAGGWDLTPHLLWAEAAVTAGGTTLWEVAHLGLPALAIAVADNQEGAVAALGRDGCVLAPARAFALSAAALGPALASLVADRGLRERLSRRARRLVDGQGAARVCRALRAAA